MENKNSNFGTIALTVIITAVIVSGGLYMWQQSQPKAPNLPFTDQQIAAPDSDLKSYKNDTLALMFNYPKDWGEVQQKEDGTDHIALLVLDSGTIFLAADNGGESVARGAYWGDGAGLIISQDYIDNLCTARVKAKSCEIKTNPAGIKYAKVIEEMSDFEAPATIEANYFFFNSNSPFHGVIMSTERLRNQAISNLEAKLDVLVDSLSFYYPS